MARLRPTWVSSRGGDLARAARAGARSVRTVTQSERLIGVMTCMRPFMRSDFVSDGIRQEVTKFENKSVFTKIS